MPRKKRAQADKRDYPERWLATVPFFYLSRLSIPQAVTDTASPRSYVLLLLNRDTVQKILHKHRLDGDTDVSLVSFVSFSGERSWKGRVSPTSAMRLRFIDGWNATEDNRAKLSPRSADWHAYLPFPSKLGFKRSTAFAVVAPCRKKRSRVFPATRFRGRDLDLERALKYTRTRATWNVY